MIHAALLSSFLSLAAPDAPRGSYVEARTASVYAGACHYGSEYATDGREALLAWRFEGGRQGAVELAGLDLVVVVGGSENLDRAAAGRSSIAWVPEGASPAQREALLAWLRAEHSAVVGEIRAVRPAALAVELRGGTFRVRAGEAVELRGAEMPNRACCKMPFNVWYRPFERIESRVVGCADVFRVDLAADGWRWVRRGENSAFLGSFGPDISRRDSQRPS